MEGKDQFIFYTDINSLFYFLGNVIYVNISKYLYSPSKSPNIDMIWLVDPFPYLQGNHDVNVGDDMTA